MMSLSSVCRPNANTSESNVMTMELVESLRSRTVIFVEYEPGLIQDIPDFFERIAPQDGHYHHEDTWHDGNGHSHLQATWLGPTISVPVADGQPVLGTWQQIFHLECDVKPRTRTIVTTVAGE